MADEHLSLRHRLHPSASVDCLIGVVMSPGGELTSLTVSGLIASNGVYLHCLMTLTRCQSRRRHTAEMLFTGGYVSWQFQARNVHVCQLLTCCVTEPAHC